MVRERPDGVVLAVSGEIDIVTAPDLRDTLIKVIQDGPSVVVVDLTAVTFLGSTGLAVLIEAQSVAGDQVGLRVVAAGPQTLRPLQVTGLDQQFDLFDSLDAALRAAGHR